MNSKKSATGGSWTSPLTTGNVVSAAVSLSEPKIDGDRLYWIESRPLEAGRQVIVSRTMDGEALDLFPAPFSARNRVHEYGGGAYTVNNGTVYFCNDVDGGIYRVAPGLLPQCIFTGEHKRFADLAVDASGQYLFCIQEDHSMEDNEPRNSLVMLGLQDTNGPQEIAGGEDFYASPTISPDGNQLAWISWSHPDMPWDQTRLWIAELDKHGVVDNSRCLLDEDFSVFQPIWSPDNRLYFSSDRDGGWWNVHRWNQEGIENLCPFPAEFGLPQWQFGMSTSGFLSAAELLVSFSQDGTWRLALLCTATGELKTIKTDYSQFNAIHAQDNRAVMLASSPTELPGVYLFTREAQSLIRLSSRNTPAVDSGDISIAEAVDWTVGDGSTVHGFFYPPQSSTYRLEEHELPPLIVLGHGGPTAATSNSYNIKVQFWTTRGFAVLDVNYRGSTGYGRRYRKMLEGNWGVADVEDCVAGARFLAESGRVDSNRLIIRGSSAGGFTTLCALTFHDTFKAGASLYGIGDLETLATDTHKFEARYLDRLVGPYPEAREIYRQRSPINFIDQLNCPVIFLQGLQDKVVPPAQAEAMVNALRRKGLFVEYVTFDNEQHGFRNSDSIQRAYREELKFYGEVFGFKPATD